MHSKQESQKIRHRYDRISSIYDLIDKPMEHMFAEHRKNMLKEAHGKVLEVGAGTGKNFEYYPDDAEVTAIDFSPKMVKIAKKKAARRNNPPTQSLEWTSARSLGKKCRYKMNIVRNNKMKKVFSGRYSNFMIINCLLVLSASFMNSSG